MPRARVAFTPMLRSRDVATLASMLACALASGPVLMTAACAGEDAAPVDCLAVKTEANGYAWDLPADFPRPLIPEDNPITEAKIELGRRLFYDKQLSENETQSCASCHEQARAFTDGRATALGSTGQDHPRNAMSLTNVAYLGTYGWANSLLQHLEDQAVVPMFGTMPVELGLNGKEQLLLERLRTHPKYPALFMAAFPGEADPYSITNLVRAISSFERTMISSSSTYDRFVRGEGQLSAPAERGRVLFNSERLECFHCHNGFNFQDSVAHACKPVAELRFHNTGLYNLNGSGDYPSPNTGLFEMSQRPSDMGRFRVPTLRNIAVTGPYMHDGSIATLSEVIDHYAHGGREITAGPLAGDGSKNPHKDALIRGFEISDSEKADVVEFLESLTDETFLSDPKLSDPWAQP